MSAINIAVSRPSKTAYIVSDSVAYTPQGKVVGHATKVRTFPHATTVLATRGNVMCINWLAPLFERYSNFDEMVDVLRDKCARTRSMRASRAIDALLRPMRRAPSWEGQARGFNPIELVLVGWSPSKCRVVAVAARSTSPVPFDLIWGDAFLAPSLPAAEQGQFRLSPDTSTWAASLLDVMKRQRELSLQRKGGETIGGAVTLTTVTEKAILQRVIHRWPDRVGKKINMTESTNAAS